MNRVRFPLYLKILAWFFLNLALLIGAGALLFQAQLQLNMDWLFAAGARERLETVRDLVIGELDVRPIDEWAQSLERFSEAYHVRFALFDESAVPLVGQIGELPKAVRERVVAGQLPEGARPSAAKPAPKPESVTDAARRRRPPPRLPVRLLMRTLKPTQYWLVTSARIDNPQVGDPMRVLLAAESDSISGGGLIFNPKPWLEVAGGAVVFSLLFWLPLVRGITRSLARASQATQRIAEGRFDVRLPAQRRDELGELARGINQMAARLDGLVGGQKRFLGDIAHELCSPLARMRLALGVLEERAQTEDAPFVRSASEKADEMSSLVNELLSFSKASLGGAAVQLKVVNVRDAALEAVRREKTESARIDVEAPLELNAVADADLLIRALANLLRNAIRHGAAAGPIVVSASRQDDEATIAVIDRGPGVPADELPRIFDPFYRADPSRTRETGNVGLGLTIVKTCVESCLGSVTALNRPGGGFEVRIRLGAAEPYSADRSGDFQKIS